METETDIVALTMDDLRAIAGFAAACAADALPIFESAQPGDPRPRAAIDAARVFAGGGRRDKALRGAAWAALRSASDAADPANSEAARSAMAAAGSAYLHPLAKASQVKHILGSAAHAARAAELAAGGDLAAGAKVLEQARQRASPVVIDVLARYPPAPAGGGKISEIVRDLDTALRARR
ncbi:MAG: hypothetical protein QM692_00580 [Thermomicrobiales bacterium]